MNKQKIIKQRPSIGIGIDQGVANCGYAVVLKTGSSYDVLESGTIKTTTKYELKERVLIIYEKISKLIDRHLSSKVDISLGCERLFYNSPTKDARNKSASIVYTNMVTGILYLIASEKNISIDSYVPGTVKKAVAGHGRASKESVEEAISLLTNRSKEIKTDHESDAIGIAITTIESNKFKKMINKKR